MNELGMIELYFVMRNVVQGKMEERSKGMGMKGRLCMKNQLIHLFLKILMCINSILSFTLSLEKFADLCDFW